MKHGDIKAEHSIFAHSRPDKIEAPRFLPLYFLNRFHGLSAKKTAQTLCSAFGLVILFILLLSATAFPLDRNKWQWIGAERIQDMLKEGSGLWLIDVRSERAYEAEHIEGSVNISSASLACKKFPINKTLILVDDSIGQMMAREAAEELVKKGYVRVYVLECGIVLWDLEGYSIVRNKSLIRGYCRRTKMGSFKQDTFKNI